jgi:predicted nucleic acid-binding protein
LILVDTSAWIAFFRDRGPVAAIVARTLEDDEAALCGPVLTELRRGFVSAAERSRTIPLLLACHQLSQPASLWHEAGDLGFALARKGVTVKSLDLLIAAYALTHSIPILTLDRDFQLIARAGIGLHLVDF